MRRQTENAFRFFVMQTACTAKNGRREADSSTAQRTLLHRRKLDGIRRKYSKIKKDRFCGSMVYKRLLLDYQILNTVFKNNVYKLVA